MCMHRILLSTDVEAQADSFLETIPQGLSRVGNGAKGSEKWMSEYGRAIMVATPPGRDVAYQRDYL